MGLILVLLLFFSCCMILVQLSNSTLIHGLFLFMLCVLVFGCYILLNMLWYGLLFFLVYIGGILVLFFYVVSLNPNPNVSASFVSIVGSFLVLLLWSLFSLGFFFESVDLHDCFLFSYSEENSYFLFTGKEVYFLICIGLFLIFILFVVSYTTNSISSALRPIVLS